MRVGNHEGYINQVIIYNKEKDRYVGKQRPYEGDIETNLSFSRKNSSERVDFVAFPKADKKVQDRANNYIWGNGKGWFSAGFGPFRRFSGGEAYLQSILASNERVAAHVSVFHESVALSNYRIWLDSLSRLANQKSQNRENKQAQKLFEAVQKFVNQDNFLPHNPRFDSIGIGTTIPEIIFIDGNGNKVLIEQLGDGYRSILSLTFELIRQMTLFYDFEDIFEDDNYTKIKAEGVILIDEIDAHLHPSWQRTIGDWFTTHFPNMQFIVTTHSPLVCQAIDKGRGSIWRLPAPGSDEDSYRVEESSEEWKRLVYGNILEAYSTDLFGEDIERSPEAQNKLKKISKLSAKEMSVSLAPEEKELLNRLIDELPSTSTTYSQRLEGRHD